MGGLETHPESKGNGKKLHSKGTRKGTFLPTTKGSKGTKMGAKMHVPGLEGANSPSLREPILRVQREQNKLRKFTPNMVFIYRPPIEREHCKGTKRALFFQPQKGQKARKRGQIRTYLK